MFRGKFQTENNVNVFVGFFTVALKCKSQQQIRKHDNKSKTTTTKQKTKLQIIRHNDKREATTLIKMEKVGSPWTT